MAKLDVEKIERILNEDLGEDGHTVRLREIRRLLAESAALGEISKKHLQAAQEGIDRLKRSSR